MVSMGIDTMVLADDVLVVLSCANVNKKHANRFNASHVYVHTMCARIVPSEGSNFSTVGAARK